MNILTTIESSNALTYFGVHDYASIMQANEVINKFEVIKDYFENSISAHSLKDSVIDFIWLTERSKLIEYKCAIEDVAIRTDFETKISKISYWLSKFDQKLLFKNIASSGAKLLAALKKGDLIESEIATFIAKWFIFKTNNVDENTLNLAENILIGDIINNFGDYADYFKMHQYHLSKNIIEPHLHNNYFDIAILKLLIAISKFSSLREEGKSFAPKVVSNLAENLNKIDKDNYLQLVDLIYVQYNFCLAYGLPESKMYIQAVNKLESIKKQYFDDHGQTIQMPYNIKPLFDELKEKKTDNPVYKWIQITHSKPTKSKKPEELISSKDNVHESVVRDLVSYSGLIADNFFTPEYLLAINIKSQLMEQLFCKILEDPELTDELFGCIQAILIYLKNKNIFQDDDLINEYAGCLSLLLRLIPDVNDENVNAYRIECRGLAMMLCALTEKFLREIAAYEEPETIMFKQSSLTLNSLLLDDKLNLMQFFSPNYLKMLAYQLIMVDNTNNNALPSEKRFGNNIRNGLAHDCDKTFEQSSFELPLRCFRIFVTTILDYYFRNVLEIR